MIRFFRPMHAILLAAFLLVFVAACSGGGGDSATAPTATGNIQLIMDYTDPRSTGAEITVRDGDVVLAKIPDNAAQFLIELFNPGDGALVLSTVVQRQQGVDSQVINLTGIDVNTYEMVITAADAAGFSIGVYETLVTVLATTVIVPVPSVSPVTPSPVISPSLSPSPSPSLSPSPSPSPSGSPSPSPSPSATP